MVILGSLALSPVLIGVMKSFVSVKERCRLVKYPMFLYFCPAVENLYENNRIYAQQLTLRFLERWVRGLNQQFAKLPYGWPYRGFESPSLRIRKSRLDYWKWSGFFGHPWWSEGASSFSSSSADTGSPLAATVSPGNSSAMKSHCNIYYVEIELFR